MTSPMRRLALAGAIFLTAAANVAAPVKVAAIDATVLSEKDRTALADSVDGLYDMDNGRLRAMP